MSESCYDVMVAHFTLHRESFKGDIKSPFNKNDVMRLGERPRSLEGKPNIRLI